MPAKSKHTPYRSGALTSARAVIGELGKVYRDMRSGLIDTSDGTRLGYALSLLARLIQDSDFEQRLAALEAVRDVPQRGLTLRASIN
jgi:hypothetical protein